MEDIFANAETLLEKLYLSFEVWLVPPNSSFKLQILVKKNALPLFLQKHLCKGRILPSELYEVL